MSRNVSDDDFLSQHNANNDDVTVSADNLKTSEIDLPILQVVGSPRLVHGAGNFIADVTLQAPGGILIDFNVFRGRKCHNKIFVKPAQHKAWDGKYYSTVRFQDANTAQRWEIAALKAVGPWLSYFTLPREPDWYE